MSVNGKGSKRAAASGRSGLVSSAAWLERRSHAVSTSWHSSETGNPWRNNEAGTEARSADSTRPRSSTARIESSPRFWSGTSGASYLRKMLDVVLFPEIWKLRTDL